MPLGSRQSALPSPASVAVHDEGDVSGQELDRDRWWALARWVGRRIRPLPGIAPAA
jgi:hypothetical protein